MQNYIKIWRRRGSVAVISFDVCQKVRSSGSYPDLLEMVTRSSSPSPRGQSGVYAKVRLSDAVWVFKIFNKLLGMYTIHCIVKVSPQKPLGQYNTRQVVW